MLKQARVLVLVSLAVMVVICWCSNANAQTINVGSSTDLFNAIQTINAHPTTSYTLNFISNVTVTQTMPDINSQQDILLQGNGFTVDGGNQYQPIVIDAGAVALDKLNVINSSSPVTVNRSAGHCP